MIIVIISSFGATRVLSMLRALQDEVDGSCTRFVDAFDKEHRVEALTRQCNRIQEGRRRGHSVERELNAIDVGALADALDSIATVTQRSSLYGRYFQSRAASFLAKAEQSNQNSVCFSHFVDSFSL